MILAAALLFCAGMVAGGAVVRIRDKSQMRKLREQRGTLPPPLWQRMEFLRRVQRDLDLTPPQRARIEGYVRESQDNIRRLWEPIAPRAKVELEGLRDRIRSELTPGQQERFELLLREGRKGGKDPERTDSQDRRRPKSGAPPPGRNQDSSLPEP